MPFCANCGISVNEGDRFCQQCGTPRAPVMSAPQTPPSPHHYIYQQQASPSEYAYQPPQPGQVMSQSRALTMLPQARMMKPTSSSDIYTIVFTPNQAIFAKLSGEILTDVVKKSQAQGKAQGKGWLGRAGDQMRAKGAAHLRYLEMTTWQILAETPGNFAIDHASVASVSVRVVYEPTNEDGPGDAYTEIEFDTAGGKLKYRLRMQAKDVVETLNNFYPGRIKR